MRQGSVAFHELSDAAHTIDSCAVGIAADRTFSKMD
jgi:hypothetical protein